MGWNMVYLPNITRAVKIRLIFGSLVVTLALLFWGLSWRFAGGLLGEGNLSLSIYDIGQGDAILVQQGNTQILIDGGPDDKILTTLGHDIPPWDRTIELLVLTHPHADHLTGLLPVFERYKIEKILYYPSVYDTKGYAKFLEVAQKEVRNKGAEIFYAQAGGQIQLGKIVLHILWPTANFHSEDINNESVVLQVDYDNFEALLLGDAEQEVQANFLSSINKVQVLKVGHHGSWNGSYEPLLRAAVPELAVISVGAGNRYGHPHQSALNLLKKLGIPILRTDLNGTVTVKTNGQRFWYATER